MNWVAVIFLAVFAAWVAEDLRLVYLGRRSISLATWIATRRHPTLIAAGILGTVALAWGVDDSWPLVLLTGLLGGHLFIHW